MMSSTPEAKDYSDWRENPTEWETQTKTET